MKSNMLAPCVFQNELQPAAHHAGGDGAQSSFTGDGNIQRESMEAAPQLKASGLEGDYRSTDYDLCFNSAQKISKKYRKMLNSYTSLTGVSIIDVTPDEVYLYGIDYWKDALKYSEMLIYVNVAIQSGLKSVIEDKLKKIFLSENGATSY